MNKYFKPILATSLLTLFGFFCSSPKLSAQTPECNSSVSQHVMSANNVGVRILNGGVLFLDPVTFNTGYEVPKGSGKHSVYAAGLWVGAKDMGGNLKMSASTYNIQGQDFWSGPIDETQPMGGVTPEICNEYDRLFNVKAFDIIKFRSDLEAEGGTLETSSIPPSILQWPARNNPHFDLFDLAPNKDLAPFWDSDGDNVYNPAKGDYPVLDSKVPDFYPVDMTWWIMNDVGNEHTSSGGKPLGIEVSGLAYSFVSAVDAVNNATFYKYKIRAAQNTFKDLYVGLYIDTDLGQYDDDYVGCIPELNTGFFYNGYSSDLEYESNPPLVGVRFLKGLTTDSGEDLGMTSFMPMDLNGIRGLPEEPIHYYQYMQGVWKDGTPLTKGGNGYGGSEVTAFAYDGDPSNPTEWSECSANLAPNDRRIVMSSGPVDLQVGGIQEIDFAIYWTRPQNAYPCPSSGHLELAIQEAEFLANTVDVSEFSVQKADIRAFPNPFLKSLTLQYTLSQPSKVSAKIYNTMGALVADLISQEAQSIGQHELEWDGKNSKGQNVPFGTYFCKLQIGNEWVTEKIVYLPTE